MIATYTLTGELFEMYEFLRLTVADYMTRDPSTVTPQASLAEAQALLEKLDVNGLPVVDADGVFVGILTTIDIMRAFANSPSAIVPNYQEIMKRPVAAFMTKNPVTVQPDVPLNRVLGFLVQKGIRSLPVRDEEGRLVGIVAREDVLRGLRESVRQ